MGQKPKLAALIEHYCTAHTRAAVAPLVTMHEGRWAYCPGGFIGWAPGHRWVGIDPAGVAEVRVGHIHEIPAEIG